jgi:hypothetical protein
MDIAKLAKELGLTKDDREKILKFAIALNQQEAKPEFVPTKAAIKELGGISSDMLRDRIQTEFTYGIHYIDARDSQSGEVPYYLWNIDEIKGLWKVQPENRRSRQAPKSNRILKIAS